MEIEKLIEKKNGYIHFKLKGTFQGLKIDKEIINVFSKIVESAVKYDCLRILLDAKDLDYKIDNIERYKIGEYIANIYKKNLIRIACLRCVNINDDFTEIVAKNRGANFKFFNDELEAINWLKN